MKKERKKGNFKRGLSEKPVSKRKLIAKVKELNATNFERAHISATAKVESIKSNNCQASMDSAIRAYLELEK